MLCYIYVWKMLHIFFNHKTYAPHYLEGTFYEKGLLVIDVHEAVGTGIAVASKGVPDQLLPGRLGDCDVIVLHPAVLTWIIDVSPVVTSISLAFMNQHSVKSVRDLGHI